MGTIRKEKAKIKLPPPGASRACDVVAIGENSIDLIALVPAWPEPDAKLALQELLVRPGGQVATAAIAAARLGARTRYLGAVGDDSWGGIVRSSLAAGGVDASLVVRGETRTRSAVVLVDRAGRRAILADRDPRLALTPADLPDGWVARGRLLMIDATEPVVALGAAAQAHATGMPVMLDIDLPGPDADRLLAAADVVITSAAFPQAFTGASTPGAALAEIDERYRPALLAVTRGAQGVVARWQGREIAVPSIQIEAVDTTGAGDAFRGAFAAAWVATSGGDLDPMPLLRRAAVAGALSCRAVGAQAALPVLSEIEQWL